MVEHRNYRIIYEACLQALHTITEAAVIADLVWQKHSLFLMKMKGDVTSDWIYKEIIGALIETYSNRIFKFALKRTKDEDKACEVLQIVSLKVLKHLNQFRADNQSSFVSWALAIALNEVREMERRNRRLMQFDSDIVDQIERHSVQTFNSHQFALSIFTVDLLAQLEPNDRLILILKHESGMTYAEIGELMNVTELAARIHSHRLHKHLAEMIKLADEDCEDARKPKVVAPKAPKTRSMSAREYAQLHKDRLA